MRNPGFRIVVFMTALFALVATGTRAVDYDYTTDDTVYPEVEWDSFNRVSVTDATVTLEYDDATPIVMAGLTITAENRDSQLLTTESGAFEFTGITLEGSRPTARAGLAIDDGIIQVQTGGSTKLGDYSTITVGSNGTLNAGILSLTGTSASIANTGTFSATRLTIDGSNASVTHNGGGFTVTGTTTINQGTLALNAAASLAGATINGGSLSIGTKVAVTNSKAITVAGGSLTMAGEATASGTVQVSAGTFTVTGSATTGNTKVSALVMSGGTTTIGNSAYLEADSLTLTSGKST
ncbi:MAG: hypothetical protein LUG50_10780 [Planctomycetaceae bacterium]|nr:hypothetical protein [Planctomycetaceae bacterium]